MKYYELEKLIYKDIDNICFALSNKDKYDSTENNNNIKIASHYANILAKTLKSNVKYNVKIKDKFIDLWIEAEKDSYIKNKINTFNKNRYLAAVLLHSKSNTITELIIYNSILTDNNCYIKADVNLLEYNEKPNESCKVISEDNELIPENGSNLNVNTIFLKQNGNLIYNIPEKIYGFQFAVEGATINSICGGDASIFGFTIQHTSNVVIGFSFNGSPINNNTGTLIELSLSNYPSNIYDIIFTKNNGQPLSISYNDKVKNYFNINKNDDILEKKNTKFSNISLHYKLDHNNFLKKISWNLNYINNLNEIQNEFIDSCKSSWVSEVLTIMN